MTRIMHDPSTAERCQYEESPVKRPLLLRWVRAARMWLRRRWRERRAEPVGLGPPSRFAEGDWVRILDADAIRATLDDDDRFRGLKFMPTQWLYCGGTYRVERVVRRILDDSLRISKISHAVVLGGVTCDGPDGTPGCGRACALFFKDEWLEPAEPTRVSLDSRVLPDQYVRIKRASEVLRTLGADGRLDGMSPSLQMLQLAGQRFRVARRREFLPPVDALERRFDKVWYILDGVRCDGAVLGAAGPCDRFCGLLWHESWLEFEEPARA
jgi:hypothetical protein